MMSGHRRGSYFGGSTILKLSLYEQKQATALKPLYLQLGQFTMTFGQFKTVYRKWLQRGGPETFVDFYRRWHPRWRSSIRAYHPRVAKNRQLRPSGELSPKNNQ